MSTVPKQSPARLASRVKKSAPASGSRRGKATTQIAKNLLVESPIEEDLSDLVPSDAVLARALRRRKVEMEWYDDGHPDAKPAKSIKPTKK